ncbi:hypothetical protein [Chryseolinea lacunae]|uniref:Uncharacterized protein n=1 Tax=Chryseolinea lacunae TaxID=2801331 RepID=A0ABS1L1F0_9BACT|nr:hypothetical protein [Chryseolinea lacunae]MBL0745352.1 hypothetical protein [Chryseolinea lacunae]
MKNALFRLVLVLAMSITLLRCADKGEDLSPVKVQFTCSFSALDIAGGRVETGESPTTLLLSLQNNAGAPVITRKEIKLLRVGNSFLADPLELAPGYYRITDFLLVADPSVVLYATPRGNSPLARAVNHPLPYGINVYRNNVTNVDMEVVDVTTRTPEEFGYVAFSINVVNPLRLSVFRLEGNHQILTSAKAAILHGTDTVKKFVLDATLNTISFQGDTAATHRLAVTKPGYISYAKDFVYSKLGNLPWKILLVQPLFTIAARVDADHGSNPYRMMLNGENVSLQINWGDGTTQAVLIDNPLNPAFLEHTYPGNGSYLIKVTGDLDKITTFYSFYGQGSVNDLNVHGLSNLESFIFGLTYCPPVVDLRYNPNVTFLNMPGLRQLEDLLLPDDSHIQYIDISGPNLLTTADIDSIINTVHRGAVVHNINTAGAFKLPASFMNENGPAIGPPSPASLAKLRELRDVYHWGIVPNPL